MLETWIWFLLACDELDVEEKQEVVLNEPQIVTEPLSSTLLTRRLSLDLAGRVPTERELQLILDSEDSSSLEEITEILLEDGKC